MNIGLGCYFILQGIFPTSPALAGRFFATEPPWRHSKWGCAVLWPPHAKSWFIGKDYNAGRDWVLEEKGTTEDEMAGWHHWLDGHESEWTPVVGDGQGGLAAVIHGVAKCRIWLSDWSYLIWSECYSFFAVLSNPYTFVFLLMAKF